MGPFHGNIYPHESITSCWDVGSRKYVGYPLGAPGPRLLPGPRLAPGPRRSRSRRRHIWLAANHGTETRKIWYHRTLNPYLVWVALKGDLKRFGPTDLTHISILRTRNGRLPFIRLLTIFPSFCFSHSNRYWEDLGKYLTPSRGLKSTA